jgi:hypothetical protein
MERYGYSILVRGKFPQFGQSCSSDSEDIAVRENVQINCIVASSQAWAKERAILVQQSLCSETKSVSGLKQVLVYTDVAIPGVDDYKMGILQSL